MTPFDLTSFRAQVARLVDREGLRPLARRLGVSVGVLRSVKETRDLRASNVQEIAQALGSPLFLGPPKELVAPERALVDGDDDEYVAVPRYDVSAAAGSGRFVEDETVVSRLAFRRAWLRAQGIEPDRAFLFGIDGDSMKPRLHDQDLALAHRTEGEVADGEVYAFVDTDGQLRVKRLEKSDGQLVLISDNPSFPVELRAPEQVDRMTIIGPVIWSCHTWS